MKEKDKSPKTKKSDFERETRVLLEEIHQQVQTVAEGHGVIVRKLDEHDQRLIRVEMVVTDMNDGLKTMDNRLDSMDDKLKTMDNRLDSMDNKLNTMDDKLKVVEHKLDKNLDNHETRIIKLEEKVHL